MPVPATRRHQRAKTYRNSSSNRVTLNLPRSTRLELVRQRGRIIELGGEQGCPPFFLSKAEGSWKNRSRGEAKLNRHQPIVAKVDRWPRVLERNCPSNFITAGFKTMERLLPAGISRGKGEREPSGLIKYGVSYIVSAAMGLVVRSRFRERERREDDA